MSINIFSVLDIMLPQVTVFLFLIHSSLSVMCPYMCECALDNRGRYEIVCRRGEMFNPIPVGQMDTGTEVIKIIPSEEHPNHLTIGPIFKDLQHLEELHITNSFIPAIGIHPFWGVPSLRYLNLTHNNITSVLESNFKGLFNLQEVYLDHNKIESIPSGAFMHLSDLKVLSLSHNRISKLSPRLFLKLSKLRSLDLSYNDLVEFGPEIFKDIRDLREFKCRSCGLANINPMMYSILADLTYLDLGYNQLKYLLADELQDLKKLETLFLDGNHFPVILEKSFSSQFNLQVLCLQRNRLAKVTTTAFANLSKLIELDISYNKLDRLEIATFDPIESSLRDMKISGNNIPLPDVKYVLDKLVKLRALSIADMNYTTIPKGLFKMNAHMKFLNLSGNNLQDIHNLLYQSNLKLTDLDLSRNKFKGFDEKMSNRLDTIENLYLGSNPFICDLCDVGSMVSRVNISDAFKTALCYEPEHLRDRKIGEISFSEFDWCVAGPRDAGIGIGSLTRETSIGFMFAVVLIVLVSSILVISACLYTRKHAAYYYTHEEKRAAAQTPGDRETIFSNNGITVIDGLLTKSKKTVTIATIDEITKDPELQILSNVNNNI
uniref:Insulin-like growth factor-binding protein complex acid labile subunit n=1 Tax=Cacopsylla melanoneura TaxID=428564 RepID=A0A8D8Z019_9HEMI